jgi:hypothetical protein
LIGQKQMGCRVLSCSPIFWQRSALSYKHAATHSLSVVTEVRESNSDPEDGSRAYYEMVVQRTPAYVDLGNDAYKDATLNVNQEFGRKYEIKSQRWVAADEI